METDSNRNIETGGTGDNSVGHHPVGMHQIEIALSDQFSERLPGGPSVERCHDSGTPSNHLVLVQAPAKTQDFEALRCVAERPRFDASLLPGRRNIGSVGQQNGNRISSGYQSRRQIPDEGTGRIPVEARIGLGEKQDPHLIFLSPGAP